MSPSTQPSSYYDLVSQMPDNTVITFHGVSWEEYEELLAQVGEASGLRLSFDEGTLEVMSLSPEHENYARFLEKLLAIVSLRLRLNMRSFGSTTIRKRKRDKGKEPDACFYVQNAATIGNKLQLDFATDPPPDIAVEVDISHDSLNKFRIYAALGVPEIWRFDGYALTIYHLEENEYQPRARSRALPLLGSSRLTNYLTRLSQDGEFQTLLAFDEWLQSQTPNSAR